MLLCFAVSLLYDSLHTLRVVGSLLIVRWMLGMFIAFGLSGLICFALFGTGNKRVAVIRQIVVVVDTFILFSWVGLTLFVFRLITIWYCWCWIVVVYLLCFRI